MLGSVSNVSFRSQGMPDLINQPGRFVQQPAVKPDAADGFVPQQGKKKSKAPAVIGTLAALSVAAAVTLGILSHKGKLPKVEGAEKLMDKVKNVAASVGEWVAEKGKGVYQWFRGKGLIGKKELSDAEIEKLVAEIEASIVK